MPPKVSPIRATPHCRLRPLSTGAVNEAGSKLTAPLPFLVMIAQRLGNLSGIVCLDLNHSLRRPGNAE
jgi:hypothetical protein